MKSITNLGIAPENYAVEHMASIPETVLANSEMHPVERQFVNGMVRLLQPKRILELGVAEGAGSVVILNAISDMEDTTLISFDVAFTLWNTPSKNIGFAADMMYPEGNKQWTLYKGVDFSQYAENFVESFDLVVIDTAHLHPVESLNFLTVLPYLSENAVVLFHDLALYALQDERINMFPNVCFANKLAYDTIIGDKLKPIGKSYLKDNHGFASMGAIQVSSDTKKYIRNVFDMLYFPWPSYVYHVSPSISSVAKIIKKHYSSELFEHFCSATMVNAMFVMNAYRYEECGDEVFEVYNLLRQAPLLVFYGAGNNCIRLLQLFKRNGLNKPNEIWDIAAKDNHFIAEIPVIQPPFSCLADKYAGVIIVITIEDMTIATDVKKELLANDANAKVYFFKEACKPIVYSEVTRLAVIEAGD